MAMQLVAGMRIPSIPLLDFTVALVARPSGCATCDQEGYRPDPDPWMHGGFLGLAQTERDSTIQSVAAIIGDPGTPPTVTPTVYGRPLGIAERPEWTAEAGAMPDVGAVWVFRRDGGTMTVFRDGAEVPVTFEGTGPGSVRSITFDWIQGYIDTVYQQGRGEIAEIMVWDQALDLTAIDLVTAYVKAKGGICESGGGGGDEGFQFTTVRTSALPIQQIANGLIRDPDAAPVDYAAGTIFHDGNLYIGIRPDGTEIVELTAGATGSSVTVFSPDDLAGMGITDMEPAGTWLLAVSPPEDATLTVTVNGTETQSRVLSKLGGEFRIGTAFGPAADEFLELGLGAGGAWEAMPSDIAIGSRSDWVLRSIKPYLGAGEFVNFPVPMALAPRPVPAGWEVSVDDGATWGPAGPAAPVDVPMSVFLAALSTFDGLGEVSPGALAFSPSGGGIMLRDSAGTELFAFADGGYNLVERWQLELDSIQPYAGSNFPEEWETEWGTSVEPGLSLSVTSTAPAVLSRTLTASDSYSIDMDANPIAPVATPGDVPAAFAAAFAGRLTVVQTGGLSATPGDDGSIAYSSSGGTTWPGVMPTFTVPSSFSRDWGNADEMMVGGLYTLSDSIGWATQTITSAWNEFGLNEPGCGTASFSETGYAYRPQISSDASECGLSGAACPAPHPTSCGTRVAWRPRDPAQAGQLAWTYAPYNPDNIDYRLRIGWQVKGKVRTSV